MLGVVPVGSNGKETSTSSATVLPICSSKRGSVTSICSSSRLWAVTEESGTGESPLTSPANANGKLAMAPEEPDGEPDNLFVPTRAWDSDIRDQSQEQAANQEPYVATTLAIPKINIVRASTHSGISSLPYSLSVSEATHAGSPNEAVLGPRASIKSISSGGRRSSLTSTCSSICSAESTETGYRSPASLLKELKEFWSKFSFFGVNKNDDTPRVWGNRMRSTKEVGLDSRNGLHKTLSKMVSRHAYEDEMKLQLRDQRISLSYLDVFESDGNGGKWIIRVFSIGATILEYLKILAGIWTFFLSLIVVAFWKVLNLETDGTPTFLWIDAVLDLLYAICLVYQLRTSILDVQTGREYCSRKAIHAHNFLSKSFWFDVISCIPLIIVRGMSGSTLTRPAALFKCMRGWRIFRTPPEHLFVPSTSFQLFQLFSIIVMGGHLIACIWFSLVHESERTMIHHAPADEAYRICVESGDGACWWKFYTVSINQGIYLLLGIECNAYSEWEHFFVTVCAPVGALVHAFMLGRILLLIQRRGALETKKNEHTMAIQEAMRTLDLPPDLQMRIVTFFTYERIHRSGHLFKELFEDLSPQLRFELQLHLYLDLVGKSRLFRKTKPRVIREIVMSLNDIIFLPGDWVCRSGDYGDSMYFIVSGECSVIDKDTVTELKLLKRQDYFGEVALLTGVARTASVRANKFCIMAHLTKDNFAPIVQKWPDEMDVLLVNVENNADRTKIKMEAAKLYGLSRRNSQMTTEHSQSIAPTQPGTALNSQSSQGWLKESYSKVDLMPPNDAAKDSRSRSHSVPSVIGPLTTIKSLTSEETSKPTKEAPNDSPEPTSTPEDTLTTSTTNTHIVNQDGSNRTDTAAQHPLFVGVEANRPYAPSSNREALSRIQSQLNQVGARVLQLQKDVVDQRSVLANSLLNMKNWAAEATKEAVTHEVRSRRHSMMSVNTATNSVADLLLTPVT